MSKKTIKSAVRRFLMEGENDTYSYGCVMLYFNVKKAVWGEVQKMIPDEDIYTEDGDIGYGRENEPHVTILYGLHDDVPDTSIDELVGEIKPIELNLRKISIFEKEDFDVVKFDIIGDGKKKLSKLNKKFAELPHTTSYPEYHPHATIAYVKAGMGKKYVKTLTGDDAISIIAKQIKYSKPDDSNKKYNLK